MSCIINSWTTVIPTNMSWTFRYEFSLIVFLNEEKKIVSYGIQTKNDLIMNDVIGKELFTLVLVKELYSLRTGLSSALVSEGTCHFGCALLLRVAIAEKERKV